MKNTILIMLSLGYSFIHAQYFMPPLDEGIGLTTAKEVYVVTNIGDTIRGKITTSVAISGKLKSFTIKSGEVKHRIKAKEARLLAVKPNEMIKWVSAMTNSSLEKILKTNYEAMNKREWVYFEQALLPKKKDKYAFLQLLNPGFDSKIKVYLDPNAEQTGGWSVGPHQLTGGEDKSYLVVFEGGKSELYKKKKYKKEALGKLFKNCDVFKEYYGDERFRWENFSEHVFVYDNLCN